MKCLHFFEGQALSRPLSSIIMKMKYLWAGLLLAIALTASARTWTSSDGERTFDGELQEYDAATGKVTVEVEGRALSFEQDKLSEADITFLKDWEPPKEEKSPEEKEEAIEEALETQKVGQHLTSRVLSQLDGDRFKRASLTKAPKYYLLYFSASW
jgi:hypothetical protein